MRTTPAAVEGVLKQDYDPADDLLPFIETASSLVDDAFACSQRKKQPLSGAKQELMERWLSAHFYCVSEGKYTSRSEGGVTVSGN